MSKPAALERAISLVKHIRYLGAALEEFHVPVTLEEGWELLRWYRQQLIQQSVGADEMNLELLDRDIELAKKRGNPFPVLENFGLCGLKIEPKLH